MENQWILLSEKEKEVIKSCFYMAIEEGLYHFGIINLDAGEEDIKGILLKFGMTAPEIEKFMKDASW